MEENPNPVNREQNDTSPQSKNQLQTPAPKKPNGRRNRLLPALLAVIGAALLGYCAWTFLFAGQGASCAAPSSEAPSVSASEPEPEPGSSESEPGRSARTVPGTGLSGRQAGRHARTFRLCG